MEDKPLDGQGILGVGGFAGPVEEALSVGGAWATLEVLDAGGVLEAPKALHVDARPAGGGRGDGGGSGADGGDGAGSGPVAVDGGREVGRGREDGGEGEGQRGPGRRGGGRGRGGLKGPAADGGRGAGPGGGAEEGELLAGLPQADEVGLGEEVDGLPALDDVVAGGRAGEGVLLEQHRRVARRRHRIPFHSLQQTSPLISHLIDTLWESAYWDAVGREVEDVEVG